MKRILRSAVISIIASLVLVHTVGAQRVGGYKAIAKDDPEVTAAAEFAVKAQGKKKELVYKLVSVDHAESQVVAGVNYRMCLQIEFHDADKDEDTTESVQVVVYRNLKKEYSLTSWVEQDCAEDGSAQF